MEKDELNEEINQKGYDGLVKEEPERETGVAISDVKMTTLSEEEETGEQVSDIKAILKELRYQYKDKGLNELLQSAASSRIFADNLLDKNYAIVANYLEENEDNPDIDPMKVIMITQDGLSRGFEGRERIELLELAGVVHEEEMQKLSKELGY